MLIIHVMIHVKPEHLEAFKAAVAGAAKAKTPTFIEVRQDAAFLA